MPERKGTNQPAGQVQVTVNPPAANPPTEQPSPESQDSQDKPDVWTYLSELTTETADKRNVFTYLRERIDPTPPGARPAYRWLTKIPGPFGPEDIKKNFGGGAYEIEVRQNWKVIYTHRFEIAGERLRDKSPESAGAPQPAAQGPAATLEDLVSSVVKLAELIERRTAGPQAPASAIDAAVSTMKTASEKALGLLAEQKAAPAAADPMAMFEKVLNIVAAMQPKENKLLDTVLGKIMDRFFAGATGGDPTDLLGKVDTLLSVVDKLAARKGKSSMLEVIADRAPEMVAQLVDAWKISQASALQREQIRLQTAQVIRGGQARPTPLVGQTPPPGSPGSPPGGVSGPAPGSRGPAYPPLETMPVGKPVPIPETPEPGAPSDEWVKHTFVELVKENRSAEAIVDWLDGTDPKFSEAVAGQSPEHITQLFALDPILIEATVLPYWPQLLEEMLAYIGAPEENPEKGPPSRPS